MRLDDFRLGNFRYYVAILIFNFASIVDKATFINQSAANLAALFIFRPEPPRFPENNRGGGRNQPPPRTGFL